MAEKGDKTTLDFEGDGLTIQNDVVKITASKAILDYLGTSRERLQAGKDKLIMQFDYSEKHRWNFIGIGVKKAEKGDVDAK